MMLKLLFLLLQIYDYGRIAGFKECDDCKQYLSCEGARMLAVSQQAPVTAELFGNSSCGFEYLNGDEIPKVCCLDFINQKLALLPESCGAIPDTGLKIGRDCGLYDFPWMALISHDTALGRKFQCSGTIINDFYILTAAHCVYGQKIAGVRVGEYDTRLEMDCQEYVVTVCETHLQDILVEKEIVHEHYRRLRSLALNDIALLRLKERIIFNHRNVGPVCLPIAQKLSNESISGRRGVVAGWGMTETGAMSPVIMKVDIPIVSYSECLQHYATYGSGVVENKICAGELNKDSCNGDSGGPLMIEREYNGEMSNVQYGIVSGGSNYCGNGLPGLYTDITKYMDWILENITS